MKINEKTVLYVCDVAELFGISKNTAYTVFKSHEFPSIKIGKRLAVQSVKLQEWLDNQEER